MLITFIALLFITLIIVTVCVEKEETKHPYIAGLTIIACFFITEYFFYKGTAITFWNFIITNTWIIIAYLLSYIISGIVWSIIKFRMFLIDKTEVIESKNYSEKELELKLLHPTHNQERIITWMIYWPFSLCWFLIHDPITRFYKWLYNKISGIYESLYKSIVIKK